MVDFLIWKDNFGKTVRVLGKSVSFLCSKRLAYGSVDSIIGKLRAIFNKYGRSAGDNLLPGIANSAAPQVKSYLAGLR